MGHTNFVLEDFLKMGSKVKKGIFCTSCGFLNNVEKIIKKSYHCKKCNKEIEMQSKEEKFEATNNHVKDFKVVNVIDDYVKEVQRIIIELIGKPTEEGIANNVSRKRNLSCSRQNNLIEDCELKDDFRDVTLACDDKQYRTHKRVFSVIGPVLNVDSTLQGKTQIQLYN